MSEHLPLAEELFDRALQLPVADRESFLTEACGDDHVLHERVEALLVAHDQQSQFLPEEPNSGALDLATLEGPGTQIDSYKLLEKLGEGGFGAVWAAEQRAPVRRRVALKIIKLGMDTKQVVARFEAERQALALMDHPNIAKVLDAGATGNGRPYFVMELVRGISLIKYCDQEKLDTNARLDLFIQVCHAIQHAHQKGVIHRDIKPSNIMVTLHDGVPVPRVIDFGIAKATHQPLTDKTIYTQYSQFIGTPAYMSPEQAEMSGLDIDTRCDIYSLGVLLYELLTGRTPFESKELVESGLEEMRRIIREREPQRPSTKLQTLEDADRITTSKHRSTDLPKLIGSLRGDLDWIVMKCLEKDRKRRYDTTNSLALDVKRHLENETVSARPPSTAYKLQKAWRRNTLAFTAALAIGATVLAALAFSSWALFREREARAEAERLRTVADESALQRYATDMARAQDAIEKGSFGRAAILLDQQIPKAGQEDLRHWEWRYLWQQVQGDELYSLPPLDNSVFTIDYSPDGEHLAIGSLDGTILIWDIENHRILKTLTSEPGETTTQCFYSSDGKTLFGFHNIGQGVRRWDTETFEELSQLKPPEGLSYGYAKKLCASPDDKYVAAYWMKKPVKGINGKTTAHVIVWDVEEEKVLWNHDNGNAEENWLGDIEFSIDSSQLIIGTTNGFLRIRDVLTREIVNEWDVPDISALAVSPDGKMIASGSRSEGTITLWTNVEAKKPIAHELKGHKEPGWVRDLKFSADGKLGSASTDQTARIWDVNTLTSQSTLVGSRDELVSLSFHPDAEVHQLVTGARDGVVSFWSSEAKEEQTEYPLTRALFKETTWPKESHISIWSGRLDAREGPVAPQPIPRVAYYYSPNGEYMFIPNANGEILEVDPITLADRGIVSEWGSHPILVFSGDSNYIFVGQESSGTTVVDLETREEVRPLEGVIGIAYASATNRLVSYRTSTREIVLWDLDRWEAVETYPASARVLRAELSPDARWAAYEPIGKNGTISIVPTSANAPLAPFSEFKAHKQVLTGLSFSPNGQWLASISANGPCALWDTKDWGGKIASLIGETLTSNGVAFSPDSRRVITTAYGKESIVLWDYQKLSASHGSKESKG